MPGESTKHLLPWDHRHPTVRWALLMSSRSQQHCNRHTLASVASLVLLVSLAAVSNSSADPATDSWLLVDSGALTLTVMQGGQPRMTLHNLAVGRFGVSAEKMRGDNMTPLGRFRITRIERDTGFHRFLRLDYPDVDRATKAASQGDIGRGELEAIRAAHRRGTLPPQNTVLGGHIGIHGLGSSDPTVHRIMNWTRGCVALTNEQIDRLLPWIRVGTTVEIR